jgi:hypothetical protein
LFPSIFPSFQSIGNELFGQLYSKTTAASDSLNPRGAFFSRYVPICLAVIFARYFSVESLKNLELSEKHLSFSSRESQKCIFTSK